MKSKDLVFRYYKEFLYFNKEYMEVKRRVKLIIIRYKKLNLLNYFRYNSGELLKILMKRMHLNIRKSNKLVFARLLKNMIVYRGVCL